jgi:hypothetical protein
MITGGIFDYIFGLLGYYPNSFYSPPRITANTSTEQPRLYTVQNDFSRIVCRTGCAVTFSENKGGLSVEAENPVKLTNNGIILKIEEESNIVVSSGGWFGGSSGGLFGGSSSSVSVTGNVVCFGGNTVSVGRGSRSCINGMTIENKNGDIYVNGKKHQKTPKKPNLDFSKSWKVTGKPNVEYVDLDGASNMFFRCDIFKNPKFHVSGTGVINILKIRSAWQHATAHISGSGSILFNNSRIDNFTANISGSGSISDFYAKSCHCSVSGSGSISNFYAKFCNCSISGSGSISGYSKIIEKSVSGSGSVNIVTW